MDETQPGFWVHGAPARDLEQVVSFLSSVEDHDRSKVAFFDGEFFYDVTLT